MSGNRSLYKQHAIINMQSSAPCLYWFHSDCLISKNLHLCGKWLASSVISEQNNRLVCVVILLSGSVKEPLEGSFLLYQVENHGLRLSRWFLAPLLHTQLQTTPVHTSWPEDTNRTTPSAHNRKETLQKKTPSSPWLQLEILSMNTTNWIRDKGQPRPSSTSTKNDLNF